MTTLYRIHGEKNALLYVGITDNLDARLRDHSVKAWWSEVRRIEREEFGDRQDAARAERKAIQRENPVHNRTHNATPPAAARIPAPVKRGGRRHLLTLAQAADSLALDEKTIRRYISAGRLTGYRIGPRAVRVDADEIDALARPIPSVVSA